MQNDSGCVRGSGAPIPLDNVCNLLAYIDIQPCRMEQVQRGNLKRNDWSTNAIFSLCLVCIFSRNSFEVILHGELGSRLSLCLCHIFLSDSPFSANYILTGLKSKEARRGWRPSQEMTNIKMLSPWWKNFSCTPRQCQSFPCRNRPTECAKEEKRIEWESIGGRREKMKPTNGTAGRRRRRRKKEGALPRLILRIGKTTRWRPMSTLSY